MNLSQLKKITRYYYLRAVSNHLSYTTLLPLISIITLNNNKLYFNIRFFTFDLPPLNYLFDQIYYLRNQLALKPLRFKGGGDFLVQTNKANTNKVISRNFYPQRLSHFSVSGDTKWVHYVCHQCYATLMAYKYSSLYFTMKHNKMIEIDV